MRTIILFVFIFWATVASSQDWGEKWVRGVVTRQAWKDQGGYHVEIDGLSYLFIRDARITVNSKEYEVPDRAPLLKTKTKVRILRNGLRIHALEME